MQPDTALHLGDPVLDREHKEFQTAAIALRDAASGGERLALETLRSLARAHFSDEDDDLRRVGSHNAQCHLDEHAAVLASLDDVLAVLVNPERDPVHASELCARLADALLGWLPEHVQQMDAGIAQLRTRERLGGQTVSFQRKPDR